MNSFVGSNLCIGPNTDSFLWVHWTSIYKYSAHEIIQTFGLSHTYTDNVLLTHKKTWKQIQKSPTTVPSVPGTPREKRYTM